MKYNKTAFIIMLVAILGSSLISGVTAMSSMAKQANDYFINGGSDKDNFSIYNDLQDKVGVCNSLLSLANNYISSGDSHIKAGSACFLCPRSLLCPPLPELALVHGVASIP